MFSKSGRRRLSGDAIETKTPQTYDGLLNALNNPYLQRQNICKGNWVSLNVENFYGDKYDYIIISSKNIDNPRYGESPQTDLPESFFKRYVEKPNIERIEPGNILFMLIPSRVGSDSLHFGDYLLPVDDGWTYIFGNDYRNGNLHLAGTRKSDTFEGYNHTIMTTNINTGDNIPMLGGVAYNQEILPALKTGTSDQVACNQEILSVLKFNTKDVFDIILKETDKDPVKIRI